LKESSDGENLIAVGMPFLSPGQQLERYTSFGSPRLGLGI